MVAFDPANKLREGAASARHADGGVWAAEMRCASKNQEARMLSGTFRTLLVVVFLGTLILLPTAVSAQSSIGGQVRDTSGAVLPGVTVEVTSPVLIEKVRSAVSDGQGRYNVVDLRPGAYQVT